MLRLMCDIGLLYHINLYLTLPVVCYLSGIFTTHTITTAYYLYYLHYLYYLLKFDMANHTEILWDGDLSY